MASIRQSIRSSTTSKRPTSAIADGQIALNTASGEPGLFFKDNANNIIKTGPAHYGASAPNVSPAVGGSTGNSLGEAWLDSALTPPGWKIWSGTAWVNATPLSSDTVQGLVELATNAETQAGVDTARAVTSSSLQSKVSDSISTASSSGIASSSAVKTAYDLANAALSKSGGIITGNLEIGTTGSLTFEGSTADGFETTLAVVDPTVDRTITFPNITGTVVTTGDSGTVTSTMIADGTIVNADVSTSAAIAFSKLASLASANILVGNASGVATSTVVSGDVTITNAGVTSITSNVIVNADINSAAAIAYSKLALSSGITNTDISASAAVAYSKLALSNSIVNADINSAAAIAGTKISPDFGSQNLTTTGNITAANHITASGTATSAGVQVGTGATYKPGIYSPGADQLAISTGGTGRVFVNASGNVGVGTTPTTKLDVVGNGDSELRLRAASDTSLIFSETTANKNWKIKPSAGDLYFQYSATAYNSGYSSLATLTSSGNLGIGTGGTAPASRLQVVGTSTFGNGVGGRLQVTTDSNLGYIDSLDNTSTNWQTLVERATQIQFHTNAAGTIPTQKAVIDSIGNLGLGVVPSTWVDDKALQLPHGSISSGYEYGISTTANAYRSSTNTWKYFSGQNAFRFNINNVGFQWFSSPSGTAGNAISFTQAMTLDASGVLGVNITDGTYGQIAPMATYTPKLGVQGSIVIGNLSATTTDRSELQFYRRASATPGDPISTHDMGRIAWYGSSNDTTLPNRAFSIGVIPDGGTWVSGVNRKGSLTFNNNVSEVARIDSSGRLLVGTSSASEAAIFQVQTPTTLSTTLDRGVAFSNTSTKTYPTTSGFILTVGLGQKLELGTAQTIDAVTPGGFSFVAGLQNTLTKSAGNTQDIERLYFYGFNQSFAWTDANTCKQYTSINDNFTYAGINANGRTSSFLTAGILLLAPPGDGTQTISSATGSTTIRYRPNGTSTINVTTSQNQACSLIINNSDAGTKTINITDHTFFGTILSLSGAVGTLNATITNLYGLRLSTPASVTGLTVTNNWGISQEWSSAKNWFAGASNQFPNITTTASGANAFLDSADSNRLYRSTSSIVYKKNVEDLDHALADSIHQFRPVWYRSNCAADCQDWSWFGLIAEEVAAIEPRLVHYGYQEDAYELVDITDTVELQPNDPRREAGQETEEITKQERRLKDDAQQVPNGVAYDRLTVLLLDVVQRQEDRIKDLEARLSALETA